MLKTALNNLITNTVKTLNEIPRREEDKARIIAQEIDKAYPDILKLVKKKVGQLNEESIGGVLDVR